MPQSNSMSVDRGTMAWLHQAFSTRLKRYLACLEQRIKGRPTLRRQTLPWLLNRMREKNTKNNVKTNENSVSNRCSLRIALGWCAGRNSPKSLEKAQLLALDALTTQPCAHAYCPPTRH